MEGELVAILIGEGRVLRAYGAPALAAEGDHRHVLSALMVRSWKAVMSIVSFRGVQNRVGAVASLEHEGVVAGVTEQAARTTLATTSSVCCCDGQERAGRRRACHRTVDRRGVGQAAGASLRKLAFGFLPLIGAIMGLMIDGTMAVRL